ncbi:MAG TPA: hypothetical protein PK205_06990 [Promineifilum sp.]|nr:hypothetical protein [Promineifilum sp.]
MNLSNAVVYDIETFPNLFSLHMEQLHADQSSTWEISPWRDDRVQLFHWFQWLRDNNVPMIGFNNVHFDYPVIHYLFSNPDASVEQIYAKAMDIIRGDRFGSTIWESDRFAPQIDLFKIHHFDNRAKTTNLKALQINMRSLSVVDMPVEVGETLNKEQIDNLVIPYNKHDVRETKRFAHFSMKAIEFRVGMIGTIRGDVMNFNDTKIGEKLLEQRIGDEICYEKKWIETGFNGEGYFKKQPRQTYRHKIALADIIFPYVEFQHPEFRRILDWFKSQTLLPADIGDPDAPVQTKGVFTGICANVGDLVFHFGTGGIHASVPKQVIRANDEWLIRDIDVASLYPSIAIVNNLAPEHLGEAYTREYSKLPAERKEWQKKKGKKCVEANSLKLAGNGVYGKSNSPYSIFYDPQYTLTITINGQLMLCMLAERLITVPTLRIIQANTDGITYYIHKDYEPQAAAICKEWEKLTRLTLEDTNYKRMFIRDVNNYIAESMDGSLKLKGAYWFPDPLNYADSVSECQPPAWHKDLGNVISIRAAVLAMTRGIPPEATILAHTDPFDFMLRVKADRSSKLMLGDVAQQKNLRYYVARDGQPLTKVSPPTGPLGWFKKANGISDHAYFNAMQPDNGQVWMPEVCTKNKSKYEARITAIESGWKIAECNDVKSFNFGNLDHAYYIAEAKKLVIE